MHRFLIVFDILMLLGVGFIGVVQSFIHEFDSLIGPTLNGIAELHSAGGVCLSFQENQLM
jgi:hypothetical protein